MSRWWHDDPSCCDHEEKAEGCKECAWWEREESDRFCPSCCKGERDGNDVPAIVKE